jgi:hypothetical protein
MRTSQEDTKWVIKEIPALTASAGFLGSYSEEPLTAREGEHRHQGRRGCSPSPLVPMEKCFILNMHENLSSMPCLFK